MTARLETRPGQRGPHAALATFHRWACMCGASGRWTRQPDTAAEGKRRHDRGCDVFEVGEWFVPWNSGHANPLHQIDVEGGGRLVFDPPDILFIPGGARLRLENYSTPRPVLAVERFDRTVERYPMRVVAPL